MPGIKPEDFIETDDKYGSGVTLDTYNNMFSLVACRKTDKGMVFMDWCFPQTRKDDKNVPGAKSLPWKITLGTDRYKAIDTLYSILRMLGEEAGPAPDTPQTWEEDDAIPF